MRLKISGDAVEKLKKLRGKAEDADRVLAVVSRNLAEETIELIREGFEREESPDGDTWAPLKVREGRILQDTGRLRNSWHVESSDSRSFTVDPGVDYARYHQSGTSRGLPARPMIPDDELPDEWRKRLSEIASRILKDHFDGR